MGNPTASSWRRFADETFEETNKEVERLRLIEDSESEPYKSKYEAAKLLNTLEVTIVKTYLGISVADQGEEQSLDGKTSTGVLALSSAPSFSDGVAPNGMPEADVLEARRVLAKILHKLGSIDVETEHTGRGEFYLTEANREFDRQYASKPGGDAQEDLLISLQDSFNMLAIVWSGRADEDKSLGYLRKAEALYMEGKGRTDLTEALSLVGTTPPDGTPPCSVGARRKPGQVLDSGAVPPLERLFTTTAFYLAQVLGTKGDAAGSAGYCSLTLRRQLEAGDYRPNDWVENATQLAGYYAGVADDFGAAEHCLQAAEYVARVLNAGQGLDNKAGNEDGDGDAGPGGKESVTVGEDVVANMHIGWAAVHLQRLKLSGEAVTSGQGGGRPKERGPPLPADGAAALRPCFPSLDVSPPAPKGDVGQCLVRTFRDALTVFKAARARLNSALSHYVLDGFVTEHVNCLSYMSSALKCLAAFEHDPVRRARIHKRRTRGLEEVAAVINPRAFEVLCKQLHHELAEIYRAIMEIKIELGRPHAKVAQRGQRAEKYYRKYLDAFQYNEQEMPRVNKDEERPFVLAHFSLARTLQKQQKEKGNYEPGDVESLKRCLHEFNFIKGYIEKHSVPGFDSELEISREMSLLLPPKLDTLLKR